MESGLTADALYLRAAFGVTEAAQAPQARREEGGKGRAGSCPSATQERRESREGALDTNRRA